MMLPAAKDFDLVARTLLSNARSDGGSSSIIVEHAEFGKSLSDTVLWSPAHPHSDESGNHPVLGRDHLNKAGQMHSYAERKEGSQA